MKYSILILLVLTACQPNRYVANEGVDDSYAARKSAWGECQNDAIHKYGLPSPTSGQIAGSVASGVVGGAIGGVIFGAGLAAESEQPKSDAEVHTEECMANRGYEYTLSRDSAKD